MRRLMAVALVAVVAGSLLLPAAASAEAGWPSVWWTPSMASSAFRQHFDVSRGRCFPQGQKRKLWGFSVWRTFVCSSTKLPNLYRVRSLKPYVAYGDWVYPIRVQALDDGCGPDC